VGSLKSEADVGDVSPGEMAFFFLIGVVLAVAALLIEDWRATRK
jgi:hypothetical protein